MLRSLLPSQDGASCRARGAGGAAPFGEVRGGSEGSSGPHVRSFAIARGVRPRVVRYACPMTRVALIGGGKMGSALLGGLLDGGWDADALAVAEVDADRRRELEQQFPKVRVVPSPAWAVADADVVIVAVKPGDVAASLQAAESSLRSDDARAVDRGRRDDRDARSARARPAGRARDAEHARARRPRRVGDRGRRHADEHAPRARVAAARRGRDRRDGRRVRARRGHRALGFRARRTCSSSPRR